MRIPYDNCESPRHMQDMGRRRLLLVVWLVGLSYVAAQRTTSTGSGECPCLTTDSADFPSASAIFQAEGFPADYGYGGCKAWDRGVTALEVGCDGSDSQPSYCNAQWCYVDPATCQAAPTECEAAGFKLNDPDNAACRSRPFLRSLLFEGVEIFYSYETCGYLNNYIVDNVFATMKNSMLIGAATHDLPYVAVQTLTDPADLTKALTSYSGVEFTFVEKTLTHFTCPTCAIKDPPTLRMIDGWATAESRAKFNSSYTACVNDVAVGNFDICIGDFWWG
eukprot:2464309-Rhodomonas_salina.1